MAENTLRNLRDVADQEIDMILKKRMEKGSLDPEHLCYLKDLVHIHKDIAETEKEMMELENGGMSGNMYGARRGNESNGGNSGYYNYARDNGRSGNGMFDYYREEYDRDPMNKMMRRY